MFIFFMGADETVNISMTNNLLFPRWKIPDGIVITICEETKGVGILDST